MFSPDGKRNSSLSPDRGCNSSAFGTSLIIIRTQAAFLVFVYVQTFLCYTPPHHTYAQPPCPRLDNPSHTTCLCTDARLSPSLFHLSDGTFLPQTKTEEHDITTHEDSQDKIYQATHNPTTTYATTRQKNATHNIYFIFLF